MTTGEFADLVSRMRTAQIMAQQTKRPQEWLEKARLEREVDGILLSRRRRQNPQPLLDLEGGKSENNERP